MAADSGPLEADIALLRDACKYLRDELLDLDDLNDSHREAMRFVKEALSTTRRASDA